MVPTVELPQYRSTSSTGVDSRHRHAAAAPGAARCCTRSPLTTPPRAHHSDRAPHKGRTITWCASTKRAPCGHSYCCCRWPRASNSSVRRTRTYAGLPCRGWASSLRGATTPRGTRTSIACTARYRRLRIRWTSTVTNGSTTRPPFACTWRKWTHGVSYLEIRRGRGQRHRVATFPNGSPHR